MPYGAFVKEAQNLLIAGAFASLGGLLHYLLKVKEGAKFEWGVMFLHMAISAFAGLISFSGLTHFGADPTFAGSLSGVAGWMGTRFMRILEVVSLKRAQVEKEDVDNVDK